MQNYQSLSIPNSFQSSMHLSPSQLQRLFDSLLSVVFAIDIDGNFVYVSKSSFSISGYLPEELMGTSYLDLILEEDKEKTQDYFRKQIYSQDIPNFENCLIRKDGVHIHISWTGRWDAKDKMFYCVVSDISEKKAAELQKQQYQVDMLNILERISDSFFSVDKNWIVTYRNQQTEQLTGKQNQQILGKNLWECYPELVGTIVYDQYHKAMKDQVPTQFEFYFGRINSWLFISAYPSDNGLYVFFRNINERKQAELLQMSFDENIKEWNSYLKNIADSMNDGFIGLDENEKVVHWNKKAEDIFDIKRYAAHRKNLRSCFSAIDGVSFYEEFANLYAEKKSGSFTIFFRQSNKWYETTVKELTKGAVIFIKDITLVKKIKEELRKLSVLTKKNINVILHTDAEGRITWANEALVSLSGYTSEEAIGKTLGELLCSTEAGAATARNIHTLIAKGQSFQIEALTYNKSKETFWSEIEGHPVKDKNGSSAQFITIITDISERKKWRQDGVQELQEQQQQVTASVIKAQERDREQVSQQLQTNINDVLTTVKLYTELCLTGAGNKDEMLRKSLNLLQSSIEDINSLSKKLSPPSLHDVSLKDSLLDLIESATATSKVEVTLELKRVNNIGISKELHTALYRILQEQLVNISAHAKAKNVRVMVNGTSSELTLKIKDDGIGFDTSKQSKGIGITNMISRTENLKGVLSINSAPGMGCELHVRFPLS
ncbi:PAS domain S-box protein [Chitinophagaceae bacterium LB-8]|uniref:histidine kinase n=1 Tax=Paraflavisolibacter caeni TaxID=2982496 RepID=A0A9X3BI95_9BACT|nr:PAS domain S-box protein [Paraflavisolibacter caeni]MCU7550957.1 PAS domain S-box protein [Paraflavisolibacter caeni]